MSKPEIYTLYTIRHSTRGIAEFFDLGNSFDIQIIAVVSSNP
jgi:hypothetical protein